MAYPNVTVEVNFGAGAYEAAASGWTEVTDYVEDLRFQYGKSSFFDEFQPGSGSAVLVNDDGRFDPVNAAGPHFGDLLPRRRIRVSAAMPSVTVLSDDFPGSAFDVGKWSQLGSGGVAVSGSLLTITSQTTATTRGLQSLASTSLVDGSVTVGPVTISGSVPDVVHYPVHVDFGGGESASWAIRYLVTLSARVNGVEVWSVAHNATTHAYMRIRRTGTVTYWETSTDGSTWTVRYSDAVAWTDPSSATVAVRVVTEATQGNTRTLSVGLITATTGGNSYPLSYGWIDGWPSEQVFRKIGRCRVQWHDALSILETAPLPDSVWAYHVLKNTTPLLWWPLDEDKTALVIDAGPYGLNGAYEYSQDLRWQPLPVSIVAEGTIDSIIPSSSRKAKNWAKVQQEVGQPPTTTWLYSLRYPTITGPYDLGAMIQDRVFTIEAWVRCRTAFPLDVPASPPAPSDHGVTPTMQPLFTMGNENSSAWFEIGLSPDGEMYTGGMNGSGDWVRLIASTNMMDGQPHYVSWASFVSGGNWLIYMYVDGVLDATVNMTAGAVAVPPSTFRPSFFRAKGYTTPDPDSRSFQSAISDIVVYDSTRTAGVIQDSYEAGFYGSLAGDVLTSGEAVEQTLDMIDWAGPRAVVAGVKAVDPGVLGRRAALQLLREFASAEQAPLFQARDGSLTMLSRGWSTELTRSRVSQYTLSDAAGATLGYEELDYAYDDSSIVNHCSVSWTGGDEVVEDATSITAYGLLDRSITTKLGSAEDARALAEWIVAAYKNPRRRVDRPLRFAPITDADWAFALDCEFGLRVTLVRTTPDARTVTEDYWVMGVAHDVEAGQGRWAMDLTLEKADDPFRMFTLDVSTLNGADVLGY